MKVTYKTPEATEAFLAMREGKASLKQQTIVYDVCHHKVNYSIRAFSKVLNKDDFLSTLLDKMWNCKDTFDPDRASFPTWVEQLCWSVRSNLYGKYKTHSKYVAKSLDAHIDETEGSADGYDFVADKHIDSPDKQMMLKDYMRQVMECVVQLSTNQKNAFIAIYVEGLKPAEACRVLDREEKAFYNDNNRAKKNLLKMLEARGITRNDIIQLIYE